ncbi:MAG: MarR family winged helix-turn-helix transcriptional regulator [Sedimentitalea sp.]
MSVLEPPLSKQRLRVWLRMLRAQRGMEHQLRDRLRLSHDCTLPRFDVLSALDRHRDGLRMSDLSAKLKVSNGNVTGIIERLVGDGLVERTTVDGDRRAMRVRLTPLGLTRFAAMAQDHELWVDGLLATYSADELEHLIALLERMGESEE